MKESLPIILIDAYSQIFRAFYAISPLNNSKGQPVGASLIFSKVLFKLEKEYNTNLGALFFDCGKIDFRLKINPEYKSNRPPMPEPLKVQIPLIREIAEAFGWQLLQCENYEADDLIGGFAKNISDKPIKIVSSDKDLMQLIDNRVTMLAPILGKGGFEERGVEQTINKFGVTPELLIDYLALLGDAADNIAGVPSVGKVTASKLLNSYGASKLWLNNPDIIDDKKLKEKILPHIELIKNNIELISLKCTLPEIFNNSPINHLKKQPPNWEKLESIFKEAELLSLIKEIPKSFLTEEKEIEEMVQGELF